MNVTIDAATNRLIGSTYDSNGNLTVGSGITLTYDISNRIATASGPSAEWYGYAPGNKRVWKKRQTGGSTYEENIYFYSAGGQRMGTYTLTDTSGTLALTVKVTNLYFNGKVIKEGTTWVARDRLGSVRARHDGSVVTTFDHFPFGEEKPSTTTQDRNKFSTYFRDHTNLDYADRRYYTSGMGRFMTPDPYQSSADSSSSASWNRFAYVENDPINYYDPKGLDAIQITCVEGDSFCRFYSPQLEQLHRTFYSERVTAESREITNAEEASQRTSAFMREESIHAIANLAAGCRKLLMETAPPHLDGLPGVNPGNLVDGMISATQANWIDATSAFEGDQPVSRLPGGAELKSGLGIPSNATWYDVAYKYRDKVSSNALALLNANTIVILPGFYFFPGSTTPRPSTNQFTTLNHELLHIAALEGDIALAMTLGLGTFSDRAAASNAISNFLTNGCPPK